MARRLLFPEGMSNLHARVGLRSAARLVAFLFLVHCGGSTPPATEATPPPTSADEKSKVTNMHLHFADINEIHLALISGNLIAARQMAKKVRVGFAGAQPKGWEPFIKRTVASAEMLEVTSDLDMAARLASTMAGTCGDCHRAQNIEVVEHVALPPPREEDKFSDFMTQHRWAAERMWEGLIGPSEAAWNAGSAVLGNTDLGTKDLEGHLSSTPEIEALLAQLRNDASVANKTQGSQNRQELYGSFLSGCAGCHLQMMNQRD